MHNFSLTRNNSIVTKNKKRQEELQMAKNYSSDASNQNKTNSTNENNNTNETSKNSKNCGSKNTTSKNSSSKNSTSKSAYDMDDESERY